MTFIINYDIIARARFHIITRSYYWYFISIGIPIPVNNLSIAILHNITSSILCTLPIDGKLLITHIIKSIDSRIWRENHSESFLNLKREIIFGFSEKRPWRDSSKSALHFCILCLLNVQIPCYLVMLYKSRTLYLLLLHKQLKIKNIMNDNKHLNIWMYNMIFDIQYHTRYAITTGKQ